MKTIFTTVFILISTGMMFGQSPITILSTELGQVGDTLHALKDTMPVNFSPGNSGPNQTWDFSNLTDHEMITTYYQSPASTSYSSDFPNANLAITSDFSGYLFVRNASQVYDLQGIAGPFPGVGNIALQFNPPSDQYHFDIEYLKNFSGSASATKTIPYSNLPQNIQNAISSNLPFGITVLNVRLTINTTYKDTIDGWGTTITPIGSYESLRRKRIEDSETIIEAETRIGSPPFNIDSWNEIDRIPSLTTDYQWLTKITKQPLIALEYDTLRNVIGITYSQLPPAPQANFNHATGAGGQVNFTDASQNSPDSWSWDFGDGGSSSNQNPVHVYASNGTYIVCLIVSNQSGNDTICHSVTVTGVSPVNNPPVATMDTGSVIFPDSLVMDVLANDFDPNGNNFSFQYVISPAFGSVTDLGNGIVQYNPAQGFKGVDSFQYVICDDGNPVLCDTGTVYVNVDGLPLADFSFSINGLQVTFSNQSLNFDNVSWDLGDGNTATLNTVVHDYLAMSVFTVCLTATNSFGNHITCKSVDLRPNSVDDPNQTGLIIYPNPTSHQLQIAWNENEAISQISLIDLMGKQLLTKEIINSYQRNTVIELNNFVSGIYLIQLINDEGATVGSARIMVTK